MHTEPRCGCRKMSPSTNATGSISFDWQKTQGLRCWRGWSGQLFQTNSITIHTVKSSNRDILKVELLEVDLGSLKVLVTH